MRFLARYSQNQIKKYQESIYRARRGGPAAELPRCRECTAGNTVELKCTGCYVTKGIDYFAKQQRKNPDNAVSRTPAVLGHILTYSEMHSMSARHHRH